MLRFSVLGNDAPVVTAVLQKRKPFRSHLASQVKVAMASKMKEKEAALRKAAEGSGTESVASNSESVPEEAY